MATLVAIGHPDRRTAERARETVSRLAATLVIQADQVASISPLFEHATPDKATAAPQQHGGRLVTTSLSGDTKKLQEALQPPATAGVDS